jgi:protease IV
MSTPPVPRELPFGPGPVTYLIQTPEKKSSFLTSLLRRVFFTVLLLVFIANIWLLLILQAYLTAGGLEEKHYSGEEDSKAKIAVIRIDGVLMEGLTDHAARQIRTAAQDDDVKAVVLQINSPGGTVTASDRLHMQIMDLKDGKWPKQKAGKPIVVQMTSIAASGGYYIAAPAQTIFAEPTTVTGSIGVYASLVNVHKLAEKHGVEFKMITRGELKGSGSPFIPMKPEQEHEWEEMIENSYRQFQKVVNDGRGNRLKHKLRDEITLTDQNGKPYIRRLADGGVFTAEQALKFGLVDKIGRLRDAIAEAETLSGVTKAKVITYARPLSWMDVLLNLKVQEQPATLSLDQVPGFSRQVWFLTPGYELAGVQVPIALSK